MQHPSHREEVCHALSLPVNELPLATRFVENQSSHMPPLAWTFLPFRSTRFDGEDQTHGPGTETMLVLASCLLPERTHVAELHVDFSFNVTHSQYVDTLCVRIIIIYLFFCLVTGGVSTSMGYTTPADPVVIPSLTQCRQSDT